MGLCWSHRRRRHADWALAFADGDWELRQVIKPEVH